MMKVIGLWSGGKDSCLACYKAKLQGYNLLSLFNFTDASSRNSLSHGLSSQIIRKQVSLLDIQLFQKAMPKKNYREEFKNVISEWKRKADIAGIVFGDIYLQEHKDWIDKVCSELNVEPILPLWKEDTRDLINVFIKAGFKAKIVSTDAKFLGEEWLGREVDQGLVKDLGNLGNIDLCGEKGEFHTFVYDGPIFKKAVEFSFGKKTQKNGHWFLEVI